MKLSDHKFEINDRMAQTYDIRLDSLLESIEKHKTEDSLDLDPDFQRGRVWTYEQQISFCEFLIRGGSTNPLLFNHPGWMSSFEGGMVIVDGLQRLTAIMGLLNDEVKVFGHKLSDYEDVNFCKRITIQIKIHSLPTRADVLKWYLQVNSTGTPHTSQEIDRVRQLLAKETENIS